MIHAMNALSVQDREALYEEIHGILPQPIDETPDFVQTKISELKESLSLVPKSQRTALDRAIFLQPSIIHDEKLHLLFLRAVRFDARQAAYLMHMHFEHKLRLFGDTKLVKTITLDDLSPAARKYVQEGSLQSHVYNNKGMLAQCTIFSSIASIPDPLAFAQYHFYQNMIALEDEEVQKQGIVRIANLKGKVNLPDILNYARKMGHIIKDRPVRVTAVHILYDNPMVEAVVSTMKKFSMLDYRLRQRLHYGSTIELQYSLLQFGIYIPEMFRHMLEEEEAALVSSSSTTSTSTTSASSTSKQKFIDDFIQRRKQVEEEPLKKEGKVDHKDPDVVAYPAEQDTLIGRGWPYQSWSRNKWLVAFASQHAPEYASLRDRHEKKVFLSSLLDTIQNNKGGVGGSRFLKRVEGIGWVQVEHAVYREKVAQLLRRAMVDSPTTTSNSNGSTSDDTRTTPSPPPHHHQHTIPKGSWMPTSSTSGMHPAAGMTVGGGGSTSKKQVPEGGVVTKRSRQGSILGVSSPVLFDDLNWMMQQQEPLQPLPLEYRPMPAPMMVTPGIGPEHHHSHQQQDSKRIRLF